MSTQQLKKDAKKMQFSIAAIPFFWPKKSVYSFYYAAAESAADIIYIGETVCSKRRELKLQDWIAIGKDLVSTGKQVVLSTMTLTEAQSEVLFMQRQCENLDFTIEANDISAISILNRLGKPFVVGSAVNVYNQNTFDFFAKLGMKRWVAAVELSGDWIANILQFSQLSEQVEIEIQSYGYLPLAHSARCFSARAENKPKDQCELCCIKYEKGRPLKSKEGEILFNINGLQIQSGKKYNLINDVKKVAQLANIIRITPDSVESLLEIERFKSQMLNFKFQPLPSTESNGYWNQIAGIESIAI